MSKKKAPESATNIAHPHTIKKFDLIEAYVKAWAQKLIHYPKCNGIVFIDCMCNSGVYKDDNGNAVSGTPIRVANYLSEIMNTYPDKQAWCFFNDLSAEKIEVLKLRVCKIVCASVLSHRESSKMGKRGRGSKWQIKIVSDSSVRNSFGA